MASNPQFQEIYQRLNQEQRQAVDTIDGPVMVVAGPGTGKTQVLAARIANILLKTDTNPSSILALTFTESAAKNMRERLISMVGKAAYYVQIQTFHAFCAEIISAQSEYFTIDRDSEALSDLDAVALFQSLLDDLPLQALKPLNTPYFYLKDLKQSISTLKREGVATTDFQKIVAAERMLFDQEAESLTKTERLKQEKQLLKNEELLVVYEEYQLRLRDSLRYDYEDMIALVVKAFQDHPELLAEYQERLLYLLVDEYQDTNSAQNQLVDLLAAFWGEEANVFVVGDPNQAIFRFQGASLENVISFTQRYPQARTIYLTIGYRSTQKIYTAAHDLISQNQSVFTDAPLEAKNEVGQPLQLFKAPSQTVELMYVATKIKELLTQGVDPSEIAVVYRRNAEAAELSQVLDKWHIQYEIDGGNNVLEVVEICQLLNLFRAVASIKNGDEDGLLHEVMLYPWIGLDRVTVLKATRVAGVKKISLFELIQRGYEEFHEHSAAQGVTVLEFAGLTQFNDSLLEWAVSDAQQTFAAWFEKVINASGFMNWILEQPNKLELLNATNSLFREAKMLTTTRREFGLLDFLSVIDTLERHKLPITIEDLNITKNAVRLSTVHKAKGQEWRYVFVSGVVDGRWGNTRRQEKIQLPSEILPNFDPQLKERNEDDRRLFYVAITRAKEQVFLSYPETIISGNRTRSVTGSLFVEELKDHLALDATKAAQDLVAHADELLAKLLAPIVQTASPNSEKDFYRMLIADFKLSATALNTYLTSTDEFIKRYLLKVPMATTATFAFGSAIHKALEHWFKLWQDTGEKPSAETLAVAFEEALIKEPLDQGELESRRKHGQEVLKKYYPQLDMLEDQPVFIERLFGGAANRTMLDDIPLTGRIDRVDWIDKKLKTVSVVDYKTGKHRSVGQIEASIPSAELSEREQALPASIRGSYKRQLLFYKLLTDLDPTFIPTVTEATFEFVEADKNSDKIVRRRFALLESEVNDLKALIKEVMAEIRSLQFLETTSS